MSLAFFCVPTVSPASSLLFTPPPDSLSALVIPRHLRSWQCSLLHNRERITKGQGPRNALWLCWCPRGAEDTGAVLTLLMGTGKGHAAAWCGDKEGLCFIIFFPLYLFLQSCSCWAVNHPQPLLEMPKEPCAFWKGVLGTAAFLGTAPRPCAAPMCPSCALVNAFGHLHGCPSALGISVYPALGLAPSPAHTMCLRLLPAMHRAEHCSFLMLWGLSC